MITGTAFWYASRATGVISLILFSLVAILGILVNRQGRLPGLPRFAVTGLHRNLSLLTVAFLGTHIVTAIVDSVQEMLSDIPPNLAEDVVRGKIRLAGGGALLPGLADRIEAATRIPAVVVDDPLRCVARGAAEILEHGDGLQRGPAAQK